MLIVMNEDEIIKKKHNFDKVKMVHTHDLININFYLMV